MLTIGFWQLITTASRSCNLAIFVGLSYWFTFLLAWKEKVKVFLYILFILAAAAPRLSTEIYIISNTIKTIINSPAQSDTMIELFAGTDVRLNLIKNAIHYTYLSAGIGVGAGNIEHYIKDHFVYPVEMHSNVHNWWVEILANYGIFIFFGYLALYFSIAFNLWKIHNNAKNRTQKMISEGFLVGWICFFFASMAPSSIMAVTPQWIFLGLILSFLNYNRITKKIDRASCTS
jgi:teichuronic acid biosynthesis protein TuaE